MPLLLLSTMACTRYYGVKLTAASFKDSGVKVTKTIKTNLQLQPPTLKKEVLRKKNLFPRLYIQYSVIQIVHVQYAVKNSGWDG